MENKGLCIPSHFKYQFSKIKKCLSPPVPTWASLHHASLLLPISTRPSNGLFSSSFTGRNGHHAFAQCGHHRALCHQCGQEHHVCHDTPPVGHLLLDALHRLPARLHSLCCLPPQWTVSITLGLTVPWASFLSWSLRKRMRRSETCGRHFASNIFKCIN